MDKNIGVIGLGAMGLGMAQSLRRAGYTVYAHDMRPDVTGAFAAQGGVACTRPSEAAASCDVLVSVVLDAAQTEAVLFGDGDGSAAAAMRPGSVFVMCSTVDPQWSAAMEKRLASLGLHYLDAPVSGGAALAAEGRLTIIASGRDEAYDKAGDALQAMAAHVHRVGDAAGAGSTVKIINQLLVGVHIAAAAEAMAFGLRQGVDLAKLHEVITHSAGNSRMFESGAPLVIQGDYTAQAALDIHVKDLGLVLGTALDTKFPLPLASTAHQMFLQASAAGHGREASAALIKIFPGIRLPALPATES